MKEIRLRQGIKLGLDLVSIIAAFTIAYGVRYNHIINIYISKNYILAYASIFLLGYIVLDLSKRSWSYTSVMDIFHVMGINLVAGLSIFLGAVVVLKKHPSNPVFIITLLAIALQLLGRYIFKLLNYYENVNVKPKEAIKKALIVGAGQAGEMLVREVKRNNKLNIELVGLLDDSSKKINTKIHGYSVLGKLSALEAVIDNEGVEEVILAIPSAGKELIKELRRVSKEKNVELKVLPSMDDVLVGHSLSTQLRDIKLTDLLGRNEVEVNTKGINELIEGKTVFVSGGAGSIGSELSRQISKYNPKRLILIDINENALYFLKLALKRKFPNLDIETELCSVRDRDKVEWVFKKYKPQVVFHAAAHKHVPQMEHNPEEAIKNNVFGTKNMIDMSDRYEVKRFVLISTDKAVNPTNIMGATKRGCEIILEDKARNSKTKFMAVRFGNVLGSNGSVIPLFKELIEEGRNLTLTHPDITRYFMTIPEAAQLVMEAGYLGQGGEVFILDMGEPVKIIDLARNLIELSGASVEIDIVGLRPGEKLYEELLYDVNNAIKTENKKIFIVKLKDEEINVQEHLEILASVVKEPKVEELKQVMKDFVSTYKEPDHHFKGE